MRVLAPPPMSATEGRITDGYQLCARCGQVMVDGDGVVLVPRLSSWLIHSHEVGPFCPPKAVRGWKVARAADTIRALENEEACREAEPYYIVGAVRSCVCLLDDKHIEAELALVEYQPSDEAPTNGADLRAMISRRQLREVGGGKRLVVRDNEEEGHRDVRPETVIRNFVEDAAIAGLDENSLTKSIRTLVEILWECRKRTYATLRTAPPIDPTPHAFINPVAARRIRIRRRGRTKSPKAPHGVLTRDLEGRPVEFALYSKRRVLKNRGKWNSEFECWTAKPKPVELPYSSLTHPKLFLWTAQSLSQLEPVDRDNPYGPVALLMRESIRKLNEQRNPPFRGENIMWKARASILARRIAREEAVPALASSSGGLPGDE